MREGYSVLVTDLDNTLFDWVEIWHESFTALVAELQRSTSIPRDVLLDEIRLIHRRRGTSEYAFVAEELRCVRENFPEDRCREIIQSANQARRVARHNATRLYPGVLDTLEELGQRGVLVIGYTESTSFYTGRRVRRLGLDGPLHRLYSPPDHELPAELILADVRTHSRDHYELKKTLHIHTPAGELKPNPQLLLHILSNARARPEQAVYVGDSPMKDIVMAQEAGVADVLALYGKAQDRAAYELLRRVTHWTEEDVARERRILEHAEVSPTHVLKHSFAELLQMFSFTAFTGLEGIVQAVA